MEIKITKPLKPDGNWEVRVTASGKPPQIKIVKTGPEPMELVKDAITALHAEAYARDLLPNMRWDHEGADTELAEKAF